MDMDEEDMDILEDGGDFKIKLTFVVSYHNDGLYCIYIIVYKNTCFITLFFVKFYIKYLVH